MRVELSGAELGHPDLAPFMRHLDPVLKRYVERTYGPCNLSIDLPCNLWNDRRGSSGQGEKHQHSMGCGAISGSKQGQLKGAQAKLAENWRQADDMELEVQEGTARLVRTVGQQVLGERVAATLACQNCANTFVLRM